MKQIILLISIISSIFTFNNSENSKKIEDRINGGWTLVGNNKNMVTYYDADNNIISKTLVPIHVAGTILNVSKNNLLIRNNKNELVNVSYALQPLNNNEATISFNKCDSVDDNEIISLFANNKIRVKEDNKTLTFLGNLNKNCTSALLSNNVNFEHATVKLVLRKNSFFSDILPY